MPTTRFVPTGIKDLEQIALLADKGHSNLDRIALRLQGKLFAFLYCVQIVGS